MKAMATDGTLCFIEKDGKFLMQRKESARFGGGKWNAPGGKALDGETPEECAVREVLEETGLKVSGLKKHGVLHFTVEGKPFWSVHVFATGKFEGTPNNGGEGELKWMDKEDLPYAEMWPDDSHWVPLLVKGKKFEGKFDFKEDLKGFREVLLKEAE